ncbi:hypothetical protein D3C71_2077770 [compost metagenome]
MKRMIQKIKGEHMNKAKGITLISLIVTIIVLLILSGVSISLLARRKWDTKNGKQC